MAQSDAGGVVTGAPIDNGGDAHEPTPEPEMHGTLRRIAPGMRAYEGRLTFGPAAYVIEGRSIGPIIMCDFRLGGRCVGKGTFVRSADVWTCPVTLQGFQWVLTGRVEGGALVIEGVPAERDLLADVVPF